MPPSLHYVTIQFFGLIENSHFQSELTVTEFSENFGLLLNVRYSYEYLTSNNSPKCPENSVTVTSIWKWEFSDAAAFRVIQ